MDLFASTDCTGKKIVRTHSACLPKDILPRSVRIHNPRNNTLHIRLLSTCGEKNDGTISTDFKTWTFNSTLAPEVTQVVQSVPESNDLLLRFSANPKDGVTYAVEQDTPLPPAPAPAPDTSEETSDPWAPGKCITIDTSDKNYAADAVTPKEFVQPNKARFNFDKTCTDCNGRNCASMNKLLGDGSCHDGSISINGTAGTNGTGFNFNCLKYEFDRGDCAQRYTFVPRMLVIQTTDVPGISPDESVCATHGDTCMCNGRVRFGNGKEWTMWRSMNESGVGYFNCTEQSFDFVKNDPVVKLVRRALGNTMPPHTHKNPKICQCKTEEPVAPCAREGEECFCNGKVQYFTRKSVSAFENSLHNLSIICTNASFKYVVGASDSEPGYCGCKPRTCITNADCGEHYWCQTSEGVTLESDDASCESGSACYCTGRKTTMPKVQDYKFQLQKFDYPERNLGQSADKQCLKVSIKAKTESTSSEDMQKMASLISYSSRLFSQRRDINLSTNLTVHLNLYEHDNVTMRRRLTAKRGQSLDR